MKSRDDFDPYCYTVEQQRESFSASVVTNMVRAARLSAGPSLLGAMVDPDTGNALFPILAAKNKEMKRD